MGKEAKEILGQIRQRKRLLTLAARGLWDVIYDLLQDQTSRWGYLVQDGLALDLEHVARLGGSSADIAAPLFQELQTVELISSQKSQGAFFSPLVTELQRLRVSSDQAGRENARLRMARSREKRRNPFVAAGETVAVAQPLRNGCAQPTRNSAQHPPPLPSLPPYNPSSLPSPPPDSNPSGLSRSGGIAPSSVETGEKKPRKIRERKLSDEQVATWKWFQDWWVGNWPKFHGNVDFEYVGNRDAPAALRYLGRQLIAWDRGRAEQVALFYLNMPELYGLADHPLVTLAHRANYYARKCDEWTRSGIAPGLKIAGGESSAGGPQRSQDRIAKLLEQRLANKEQIA